MLAWTHGLLFPSSSVVYSRTLSAFLEQIMSFLTGGQQKIGKPVQVSVKHGFPPLWLENFYCGQHSSIWVRKSPSLHGDCLHFYNLWKAPIVEDRHIKRASQWLQVIISVGELLWPSSQLQMGHWFILIIVLFIFSVRYFIDYLCVVL